MWFERLNINVAIACKNFSFGKPHFLYNSLNDKQAGTMDVGWL